MCIRDRLGVFGGDVLAYSESFRRVEIGPLTMSGRTFQTEEFDPGSD